MFIPKSNTTISNAIIGLPVSYLAKPVLTDAFALTEDLLSFGWVLLSSLGWVWFPGATGSTITVTYPVPLAA